MIVITQQAVQGSAFHNEKVSNPIVSNLNLKVGCCLAAAQDFAGGSVVNRAFIARLVFNVN
jgi:hypothetical protein